MNKTIVALTNSQIDNLIDFIEFEFIGAIRRDKDMDNIDYVVDMMDTLKVLRIASNAVKTNGNTNSNCEARTLRSYTPEEVKL